MFGISRETLLKRAALFVVLGSALGAQAGTLYTIDTDTNELQTFDTRTLTFTNVATVSTAFDFGNLAYSGTQMYMSDGFEGQELYTLNLTTGAATAVGSTGVSDVFGLAFDGSGDLYGGLSTLAKGLYSINSSTGAASEIGNPGINLDALAYLPTTGQMLGIYAGNSPTNLYSINTSTGAATAINNNDTYINNAAMTYDPDTGLLWVVDWSGQVISINPNTWQETVVLSGLDAHDGLAGTAAPTPEPATMIGIGLGAAALLRRRRK